tara:strand:- start:552 stop:713 length:162 start_codon:yes stop_codon:yes gene_type:complete
MTLDQVLEALKKREPIFHREEFGQHRADFENMIDETRIQIANAIHTYNIPFIR